MMLKLDKLIKEKIDRESDSLAIGNARDWSDYIRKSARILAFESIRITIKSLLSKNPDEEYLEDE